MSLIKIIRQQLGLSDTPANNFTLDASADNGTMKLARGNAGATTQDIMTVDAAGKVAFPQNVQTWQDLTASRTWNTDYTNDTGQKISVHVTGVSTQTSSVVATVGGVQLVGNPAAAAARCTLGFEVPPGATYNVTILATVSSLQWRELR